MNKALAGALEVSAHATVSWQLVWAYLVQVQPALRGPATDSVTRGCVCLFTNQCRGRLCNPVCLPALLPACSLASRDEYLATGVLHMTNAVSFLNNSCNMVSSTAAAQHQLAAGCPPPCQQLFSWCAACRQQQLSVRSGCSSQGAWQCSSSSSSSRSRCAPCNASGQPGPLRQPHCPLLFCWVLVGCRSTAMCAWRQWW